MPGKKRAPSLETRLRRAIGFILDMDGTILDSFDAHARAWARIVKEHGFTYTKEEIVVHFGKPTPVIAATLLKDKDKDFIAMITAQKVQYFMDEIPSIRLFPGTHELLTTIKQAGKKTCIASSSANVAIQKVISGLHLEPLIDAFVGLNDITKSKPDPEMILASAARLGLAAEDCIVVGDTIYDIKAGVAAGCISVGVLTGNMTRDMLVEAGADLVLPGISKLQGYVI